MKDGRALWFPQLAQKGVTAPPNWKNSIAEDGRITEERLASGAKVETEEYSGTERLVFARFRDPVLGVGHHPGQGQVFVEPRVAEEAVPLARGQQPDSRLFALTALAVLARFAGFAAGSARVGRRRCAFVLNTTYQITDKRPGKGTRSGVLLPGFSAFFRRSPT